MKYLLIQNKGELDVRLISLMGGSTKSNDHTKIGQFGTGLKYAISWLVRHNVKFHLFVGESEVKITSSEQTIGDKVFTEIYCNGQSMNITTHYGYQWQAWQALREIWCNAIDEGEHSKTTVDARSKITGAAGVTKFYIEQTKDIAEVLDKWDSYFLNAYPLFENDKVAIYPNTTDKLKLYKNGVLILDSEYYKSIYNYDLKTTELNELRQYQGYHAYDIGEAILQSNREVVKGLLEAIKNKKSVIEATMDWNYCTHEKPKVKSIFSGWLFLHPDSTDKAIAGKSVRVSSSLFKLLYDAGLPTEKVKSFSGGYYGGGGSGFNSNSDMKYKPVSNPDLQHKIFVIATKYGSDLQYSIAVPHSKDFDFLISHNLVIFNSALESLSDKDLEATVLIGILHAQEGNLYRSLKRLIKFAMNGRNFIKIFFGRDKISTKSPKYIEYADTPKVKEDDLLPF